MARTRRQRGGRTNSTTVASLFSANQNSPSRRSTAVRLLGTNQSRRSLSQQMSLYGLGPNQLEFLEHTLSKYMKRNRRIINRLKKGGVCIHNEFPRVNMAKQEYMIVFSKKSIDTNKTQRVIMVALRPYNKEHPIQIEERPISIAALIDEDGVLVGYKTMEDAGPIVNLFTKYMNPACAV